MSVGGESVAIVVDGGLYLRRRRGLEGDALYEAWRADVRAIEAAVGAVLSHVSLVDWKPGDAVAQMVTEKDEQETVVDDEGSVAAAAEDVQESNESFSARLLVEVSHRRASKVFHESLSSMHSADAVCVRLVKTPVDLRRKKRRRNAEGRIERSPTARQVPYADVLASRKGLLLKKLAGAAARQRAVDHSVSVAATEVVLGLCGPRGGDGTRRRRRPAHVVLLSDLETDATTMLEALKRWGETSGVTLWRATVANSPEPLYRHTDVEAFFPASRTVSLAQTPCVAGGDSAARTLASVSVQDLPAYLRDSDVLPVEGFFHSLKNKVKSVKSYQQALREGAVGSKHEMLTHTVNLQV